jgi:signal transduction histidine kinase
MPETVTIPAGKLVYLEERAKKLALEKSYMQLVMRMMNRVSAASGLEDTISCMLRNTLDVVGGTNLVLYYWIDSDIYSVDVFGNRMQLDAIEDELVQKVRTTREPVESEQDFCETQLTTPEFTKAYTWVYPLRTGQDLIGVLKMERLHIGMHELEEQLPTFFNHAAMVLKNEILGQTRLQQSHDQLSLMNEELQREVAEREMTEERVELRTNDLEAKRSELEESQLALMNIVEDLNLKTTELENANAKLLDLDRLKSMFIASMSHELRTPLNSIIGFSSILRDGWLGTVNPEQKENLDTILRAGKHLLSLINDVIDVSKIEAGRIEARFEEFDLYDLLTEAIQYVEKDILEKGLQLKLQLQHQQLHTDKRRLMQCIINLLSNSVKFTEAGEINVSSSRTEARQDGDPVKTSERCGAPVFITICDTGIGIAEDNIPRIFEPFVRLESPLKATVPGTGLGLYLTRKLIVEVLGGDILCTSIIGRGSTFTLIVPERIYEKGTGNRG